MKSERPLTNDAERWARLRREWERPWPTEMVLAAVLRSGPYAALGHDELISLVRRQARHYFNPLHEDLDAVLRRCLAMRWIREFTNLAHVRSPGSRHVIRLEPFEQKIYVRGRGYLLTPRGYRAVLEESLRRRGSDGWRRWWHVRRIDDGRRRIELYSVDDPLEFDANAAFAWFMRGELHHAEMEIDRIATTIIGFSPPIRIGPWAPDRFIVLPRGTMRVGHYLAGGRLPYEFPADDPVREGSIQTP